MVILFVIGMAYGLFSYLTQKNPQTSALPIIGKVVFAWLAPGVIFIWLAPRIDAGRRWAVITAATAAGVFILAQVIMVILFHSNNGVDVDVLGAVVLAMIAAMPCGLVLVLCSFVWSDARDVSRAMERERLAAQHAAPISLKPAWTIPPPPKRE